MSKSIKKTEGIDFAESLKLKTPDELLNILSEIEKFIQAGEKTFCGTPPFNARYLVEEQLGVYKDVQVDIPENKTRKIVWSTRELFSTDFPEPKWIVPGLIPEGYSLFAGPSKMGKSWMVLSVVTAVAAGGYVLGKIKVDPGPTLYLALEDTARRMKSRLIKTGAEPRDDCQIVLSWPREKPVEKLREWLEKFPETRLCVIDTLGMFAHIEDGNDYHSVTNFVSELKAVADETETAIVCVHHTRKAEASDFVSSVLGSQAFAAGADTTMVLRRDRMSRQAVLSITGRDVEEKEYAMDFDASIGTWSIKGEVQEIQKTEERQIIFDIIKRLGPMTPKDMHRHLQETGDSRSESAIKKLMWSMSKDGKLNSMSGVYCIAGEEPVTPVTAVTHGNSGNRSNPVSKDSVTELPGLPVTPGVTGNESASNVLDIF